MQILAEMQSMRLFDDYALGGAMAAIYYIEPYQTEDIDVIFRPIEASTNSLLSLSAIYNFLGRKGFENDRLEEMVG